ncbi:MAG: SDR family oxidoreductase [Akkermansiaceae bacterium]|nr:SDR family oxidoreductase [Akkermansiaceae bacterium]
MQTHYSCVMITGASSGLGEEFAKQLAGSVDRMVLVARRVARLDQIAGVIRDQYPQTAVMVMAADLSNASERVSLMEKVSEANFAPDFLINNAGLGDFGEFETADWESLEAMLRVNIEALTHLSHLALPEMKARGGGGILNVSSLASTLPIPDFAVYAATKAYVSSFSEALRIELADDSINVMSLCPGPVKTEFGEIARREGGSTGLPGNDFFYVPKQQVVSEAIRGFDKGKARVFPGLQVAAAGFLLGAAPIVLLRLIMGFRPRR